MKLAVLLLVAVLLTGCQENAPVSAPSPATENASLAKAASINNPVDFSYIVENPYKFPYGFLEASGTLTFDLSLNPELKEVYDLTLQISGQLYSLKPKEIMGWTATKSLDQIDFSSQDTAIAIKKSMLIEWKKNPFQEEAEIPLLITMELLVYQDDVRITSLRLSPPDLKTEPAKPVHIDVPVPIDFSYIVKNPHKSADAFLEVSGKVHFELSPSPILHKEVFDLTCFIEGQVFTIKPKDLLGQGAIRSSDKIEFSNQDKGILIQKSFPVEGMKTPLLIAMKLMVFRTTIQVSDVWLALPDNEPK